MEVEAHWVEMIAYQYAHAAVVEAAVEVEAHWVVLIAYEQAHAAVIEADDGQTCCGG